MNWKRGYDFGAKVGEGIGQGAAATVGVAVGTVGGVDRGLKKRFERGKVDALYLILAFLLMAIYLPKEAPPQPVETTSVTTSSVSNLAEEKPQEEVQTKQKIAPQINTRPDHDVPYKDIFQREAERVDMPWQILAGVASWESGFNRKAISGDGFASRGLGQFIYSTWVRVTQAKGWTWNDAFDPEKNIWAIAEYLNTVRRQVHKSGMTERQIVKAMVVAYNWGPLNVQRYGPDAAPARTKEYANWVLKYAGY